MKVTQKIFESTHSNSRHFYIVKTRDSVAEKNISYTEN